MIDWTKPQAIVDALKRIGIDTKVLSHPNDVVDGEMELRVDGRKLASHVSFGPYGTSFVEESCPGCNRIESGSFMFWDCDTIEKLAESVDRVKDRFAS